MPGKSFLQALRLPGQQGVDSYFPHAQTSGQRTTAYMTVEPLYIKPFLDEIMLQVSQTLLR